MEGLLADVGHVAAAGNGRHGRQVSAEAAHDLDDEHPLFRSGAGLISTLSRIFSSSLTKRPKKRERSSLASVFNLV